MNLLALLLVLAGAAALVVVWLYWNQRSTAEARDRNQGTILDVGSAIRTERNPPIHTENRPSIRVESQQSLSLERDPDNPELRESDTPSRRLETAEPPQVQWIPEPREVIEERRLKVQALRAKVAKVAQERAGTGLTERSFTANPRPKKRSRVYRQFVVVDLETTGLSPQWHQILEIGAIKVDVDQANHPTFQTFVRVEGRIPKRITEITGITNAMIHERGVPLAEALSAFLNFAGEMPLVAYNAAFDMGFLRAAAAATGCNIANESVCALQLARKAWPGLESYKLSDMARLGELDMANEHRAVGDCTRTAHIYFKAASKLSGQA